MEGHDCCGCSEQKWGRIGVVETEVCCLFKHHCVAYKRLRVCALDEEACKMGNVPGDVKHCTSENSNIKGFKRASCLVGRGEETRDWPRRAKM